MKKVANPNCGLVTQYISPVSIIEKKNHSLLYSFSSTKSQKRIIILDSGVTGGGGQGGTIPETSDRENFADVSGKNREGKKRKGVKIEKKRRKMVKGRLKIGYGSTKSSKKM